MKKTITNRYDKKKRIMYIIVVLCVLVILNCEVYAATTPTLVNKLTTAFKRIIDYIQKIGGPAAGVAIASGVMIRKFSFGDEDKMVTGKRVIINAIVGYAIILLIDLILKFIEGLI